MNRTVFTLLLNGVSMAGTADPEQVLFRIEESLTLKEYKLVQGFLSWVHETGRKFGHGNVQAVWNEWRKAVKA